MPNVSKSPYINPHFHDENGDLAYGYTIESFDSLTNLKTPIYTDATGTSTYDNPLTLNSSGEPDGDGLNFAEGITYKLILRSRTGESVKTFNNITGVAGSGGGGGDEIILPAKTVLGNMGEFVATASAVTVTQTLENEPDPDTIPSVGALLEAIDGTENRLTKFSENGLQDSHLIEDDAGNITRTGNSGNTFVTGASGNDVDGSSNYFGETASKNRVFGNSISCYNGSSYNEYHRNGISLGDNSSFNRVHGNGVSGAGNITQSEIVGDGSTLDDNIARVIIHGQARVYAGVEDVVANGGGNNIAAGTTFTVVNGNGNQTRENVQASVIDGNGSDVGKSNSVAVGIANIIGTDENNAEGTTVVGNNVKVYDATAPMTVIGQDITINTLSQVREGVVLGHGSHGDVAS